MQTAVYLEVGEKRVFSCSVDWPGLVLVRVPHGFHGSWLPTG